MTSAAFPALSDDHLRALEQLRQRLSQLSTSLASLKADLERNDIPTWSTLQEAAQLVSLQLGEVQSTLMLNAEFFRSAHVYPMTTFPANTQEAMLTQLLRKKLEPSVEEWVKGFATAELARDHEQGLRDMWSTAGSISKDIVVQFAEDQVWDDVFTIAEKEAGIENVNTGIKRALWEDDEEEDDEAMEDVQHEKELDISNEPSIDATKPPLGIDQMLRAISTGRLPS